jgi:hypothetical protein
MATRLISLTDAYAHPALGFEEPATPIDAGRWRLAVADEHGRLRTRGYWGRERSTIVAQHLGAADVYASRCAFAPKGGFDAQSVSRRARVFKIFGRFRCFRQSRGLRSRQRE